MGSSSVANARAPAEYFIYWVTGSGRVVSLNTKAGMLAEKLCPPEALLRTLFQAEGYRDFAEAVKENPRRRATLSFPDGRSLTLSWEFATVKNGTVCTALDTEHADRLSGGAAPDELAYKQTLLNILPAYVADELMARKSVQPKVFRHCTILFTDVVSFSRLAFHLDPVTLIRKLNGYVKLYDGIMDEFGIEKIKTIGDSYMCVSGIPRKKPTHSVDCCLAALNILYLMERGREPERLTDGLDLNNWSIRIGIHTGPCISGVVGYRKYTFDIWGDSVNVASRMEKAGEPGRINVSEDTFREVKDFFECTFRGSQDVKNIGNVKMYFLNRIVPELSEDAAGYLPNTAFIQSYCERFLPDRRVENTEALPRFVHSYLALESENRE